MSRKLETLINKMKSYKLYIYRGCARNGEGWGPVLENFRFKGQGPDLIRFKKTGDMPKILTDRKVYPKNCPSS